QPQTDVIEVSRERTQLPVHTGTEPSRIARERFKEGGAIGHYELGRPGRGGCTRIRDEIGNREIDLVADARDDRNRTGPDGACQPLIVEGPQILERAAATGKNQYIAVFP